MRAVLEQRALRHAGATTKVCGKCAPDQSVGAHAEHVASISQPALADSQRQIKFRVCGSVAVRPAGDDMQEAAIEIVQYSLNSVSQGPRLACVCQHRADRCLIESVDLPYMVQRAESCLRDVHSVLHISLFIAITLCAAPQILK